jgi:hypothetical protein
MAIALNKPLMLLQESSGRIMLLFSGVNKGSRLTPSTEDQLSQA